MSHISLPESQRSQFWTSALIIFVALAVRLIHIDQPFVDSWSWRQSDVAAIARNFYANGFHFARPQIDWAGESAGYVGTEFPILPFFAALCYKIGGVHEWIGRIQGVIFFAAALPFFYLLVRQIFGEVVAVWSTIFYSFAPLSVVASRAFMPDIPSLSLALAGLYFYLRWIETDRALPLLASGILISVSLLIKLPTAIVGAPLLYLTWQRFGRRFLRRAEVWIFAAFALIPPAIWYVHAHQIAERYYPFHFFGAGGFRIMVPGWYGKIAWQTITSSLTPILFALAVAGAFVMPRHKYSRLFHWWLLAMVLFILVVGWGNRHQWYQMPLVPIAAVFAGVGCARLTRDHRVSIAAALLLVFGGWSYVSARPFFRSTATGLQDLGLELKKITPPSALIIAADDGDPMVFYYAERKGWHFLEDGIYEGNPIDSAQIIANLEKLRRRGAGYLVFYAGTRWWLDYFTEFADHLQKSATLVEKTPEFIIYRLNAEQTHHTS